LLVLLLLCCFFIGTSVADFKMVFYDDFNDFDLSVWQHEINGDGGGNGEFEYYANNRSNSYVRNSILYLKPTYTNDATGSIVGDRDSFSVCRGKASDCFVEKEKPKQQAMSVESARIRTKHAFSFMYGKIEIRAQLPKGDWLWPALWFLPTYSSYGLWPASGEIDMVESRGNVNYPPGGVNQVGSTLHWGPYWPVDPFWLTHDTTTLAVGDFSMGFHIFGMLWNETDMITYLDKPTQEILHVKIDQTFWERGGWNHTTLNNPWQGRKSNAPFDQSFHILMNVAVGGTGGYFPDGYNKPWKNADPNAKQAFLAASNQWYPTWQGEQAAMQVDWVKVYQNES